MLDYKYKDIVYSSFNWPDVTEVRPTVPLLLNVQGYFKGSFMLNSMEKNRGASVRDWSRKEYRISLQNSIAGHSLMNGNRAGTVKVTGI